MRIAVVGTGGTGGLLGGMLVRAGEDVILIARGESVAAIRERGLTVNTRTTGEFTVAVPVTDDPRLLGPMDFVLCCVKTYDIATATEQIRPLIGRDTMILPVQNGIDSAERLADALGPEHVIGGTALVGATRVRPGVIEGPGGVGGTMLTFGERAGGTSARTERLLAILTHAGITAAVHPDIRVAIWNKFLMFGTFGSIAALTRLPYGTILACPETRSLCRGVLSEIEAVARACAVGLPVDCVERALITLDAAPPQLRPSLFYDLDAGRRLEIDSLNGALVRLGHEHSIPTPLNFAIYAALKPYSDGAPILP